MFNKFHKLRIIFVINFIIFVITVFISIDCGYSSEPYTDINSIEWVGDDQYIKTGESRNVTTEFSRRWTTVREFPTRKKNCYSIDVNSSKAEDATMVERVLVRASFYLWKL